VRGRRRRACTLRAALAESNALTFCSAQTVNVTARARSRWPADCRRSRGPSASSGRARILLAVSGNNTFRLVNILLTAPGTVTINDLAFTNGGKGAVENATALEFNNNGTLALNRDEFCGNSGPPAAA
jgi:hypothetical protein